jgi:hypothetical protein
MNPQSLEKIVQVHKACRCTQGKEDNIPLTVDNDDSTLLDSVERDEFIIHNDIDIVIMIKIDKIRSSLLSS